jgi:glycosyltransferase involved in cell wall biosynthesis
VLAAERSPSRATQNDRRPVAIVDWLGRGGIAQTTEAWASTLNSSGDFVASVLTRAGREITADGPGGRYPGGVGIMAHGLLAQRAARWIRANRPSTVVFQNFMVPIVEWPVFRAASQVGAKIVFVVHDDRLLATFVGSHAAFGRLIHAADVVVCHSRFVAEQLVARYPRVTPQMVPHPLPVGVLDAPRPQRVLPPDERPTALHLGVLKRQYKGTDLVRRLATVSPSWRFAFVGVGAPQMEGSTTVRGFRPPGELVRVMQESDVVLLPYRRATQSGVVVLAHATGVVPVVHAVGGLPEQVRDGADGVVLPSDADVDEWSCALEKLLDAGCRKELAARGLASVTAAHELFRGKIGDLLR